MRFPFHLLPLAIGAAAFLRTPATAADEIVFNRDIQPILSDKCYACHGFDPKTREADLRLDTFEGATADNAGTHAIVPGDPAKSEAWARIITKDEDDLMPPKKSHKKLSDAEKELIKRWIEQGAKYQKHWAFELPQKPALPEVKKPIWARNGIDRFILAALEKAGMEPAPEADRRTLARRVSLDLTGLPPTPEEVEVFVKDPAADAYEQYVRRLMDSPHWGEHRGRYWLDAARYGDTHGLHFDNFREMWPYRDWVISAFNRNQPFDLFTIEQIAGDLLPKPNRDQLIATGFQRCNITTNEGGTIDDENLANYANDRVTTLSWIYLGLSANCAACHDHKFDPITQRDFYSMAAFFRNTTQPAKDGNIRDSRPVFYLPKAEDEKRFAELQTEVQEARKAHGQRRSETEKTFGEWVAKASVADLDISSEKRVLALPLTGDLNGHGPAGPITLNQQTVWRDDGKLGKTPDLDAQGIEVGHLADFEKDQAFSVAAWVRIPKEAKNGAVVARLDDRGATRLGWALSVEEGKVSFRLSPGDAKAEIRATTNKAGIKADTWHHVAATYDGSGTSAGIRLAIDGKEESVSVAGQTLGNASIRTPVTLRLGRREFGAPLTGGSVQDVRIFERKLAPPEIRALQQIPALRVALATPLPPPAPANPPAPNGQSAAPPKKDEQPNGRTPQQTAALLEFYLGNKDGELAKLADRLTALEAEDKQIKARSSTTLIQEEKKDSEPMAHILVRGAYDKPGDQVPAATFSALHGFPANAPKNRLGLAQWLVAKENPLTARVTVNRFWQELFGTGLVRTSEDFGIMGDRPSHPELLDWLALEFQASGWDVKRLFTLMVTSSAYRQSAVTTPEKRERDPQNRLLSRGPRFRMDAEMIRDYALAVSDTLVRKLGGPSVRPYQPEGVWEAVAMPESNTRNYKRDSGEALYRRSMYTFWKRAAPPALMDILNAPSRETCTVRRERTNTPLQALATLNDPQFVEAARKLAELAIQSQGDDTEKAIDYLAQRVLLRPLTVDERKIVSSTYTAAEREYSERPEHAKQFTAIGESKPLASIPPTKLAAMSIVANQLLCLDEALNK